MGNLLDKDGNKREAASRRHRDKNKEKLPVAPRKSGTLGTKQVGPRSTLRDVFQTAGPSREPKNENVPKKKVGFTESVVNKDEVKNTQKKVTFSKDTKKNGPDKNYLLFESILAKKSEIFVGLGLSGFALTALMFGVKHFRQFVWNSFSAEYRPTDRKHTYYPSVMIDDHLYELKISDGPVIPYFPVNTYYEWADFRFFGLRNATAYILVFDLSNVETFQYVRMIREQIFESRDMRNVPLLIVGNKQDLLISPAAGGGGGNSTSAVSTGGSGTLGGGSNLMAITSGNNSGVPVTEYREKRRDIVTLVKKHWKCGYVECSAKYNWHVVAVFKDLMLNVNSMAASSQGYKEVSPMMENFHEALDRNKCCIL